MPPLLLPIALELLEWLVMGVIVGSVITSVTQEEEPKALAVLPLPVNGAAPVPQRRYRIVK